MQLLGSQNDMATIRLGGITITYDAGPKPIAIRGASGEVNIVALSKDSDLEAFSHNPTDGSFAALAP